MQVLLVDLNNFARYPSIAVGSLVATLRRARIEVEVVAPMAQGLSGVVREATPRPWSLIDQRLRYRTAVSRNRWVRRIRASVARLRLPPLARHADEIAAEVNRRIGDHPGAVLVSTYLMYYEHCWRIGELCQEHGVPLLIGGPYFSQTEVAREWTNIPGLSALVGGEADLELAGIVTAAMRGEDLSQFPSVWRRDGELKLDAAPLQELDRLPFPDYSDFPWSKYPNRIIPIIAGRGCAWGACTFCSDVTSTAGRTFRSRSPDHVLAEIEYQARRHGAQLFVFTDLKLNSNVKLWRALIDRFQDVVPGGRWIASVHVGSGRDQGLTPEDLHRPGAQQCVRNIA